MIYADYNGSAPILPAVREYLKTRIDSEIFANPNAIHSLGQKVYQAIEKCRSIIASIVGCYPDQITFNSGASEGISNVIHSVLEYAPEEKKVVITSPIEHIVVHKALNYFQDRRGFKIVMVKVHASGIIDFEDFKKLTNQHKNELALVTIMASNNETGVIQPYLEIAKICQHLSVPFFSDTTQMIGKDKFNFSDSGMDFAVCAGHKVGSIPGIGFVISKDPARLKPYIFGSYQEKGKRGGTQNYLGIETLAVALKNFDENKESLKDLKRAREEFEKELKNLFPQVIIIGESAERLPGTSLIGFAGLHGQAVQIELETQNIFVTTSAACSDNQPETSLTLKAMGIEDKIGRSVVRISLSYSDGKKEYSRIVSALKSSYNKLSKIESY